MDKIKTASALDGKNRLGSDKLGFGILGGTPAERFQPAELGVSYEPGTSFLRDYGAFK